MSASATIGEVVVDLRSGFASGEDDPAGIVQFRMHNVGRTGEVNWEKIRRVPAAKARDDLLVEDGDILFNATNSPELVGKTAFFKTISEPVTFSNHFIRIRTCRRVIEPRYLARWLQREFERGLFASMCRSWVNQASITKDQLASLSFPLPTLVEQRRIAAILDKADALRRRRKHALELFDSLTQSIFLQMFAVPSASECKTRTLGSLCSLIRDGTHQTPQYVETGVPFVTVKNITGGTLDLTKTKFVSMAEHRALTKRVCPQPGDILVSKDGTIGIPCVVPDGPEFSIFVSVALLRLKKDLADPIFIAEQIKTDVVQQQVKASSKGIAIRHLHLEDFDKLRVLVPPLRRQRQFLDIVKSVNERRIKIEESLRLIDSLFASLQRRAFSGQL